MMKRKINTLKLIIPALTLTLTLMGNIILPCTASGNSHSLPQQRPAETEQSAPNPGEGLQPLTDLGGTKIKDNI